MGIFYTAQQQVLPAIQTAIHNALMTPPPINNAAAAQDAGARTAAVAQAVTPAFSTWRFVGAVIISGFLLTAAIWTKQHQLDDISKALMTSFTSFSGIVLGLLGGEAQKSVG
jgi:hypothetical protein